jgi:8-oxo-dGTP pyrophosphatase MutT (NUDIX family)
VPIAEFVRELREKVGTDLLFLPGVSGVVLNDAGEVLLGQRADNGRWSTIGGMLEPGEEPAAGIVREIYEETGVHAEVERIASVLLSPVVTYPDGNVTQYLTVTFRCRAVGGEARVNDDESLAVGWFAPHALPDLAEHTRVRLEQALTDEPAAWFIRP